ncbi:MAG: hypothetical protein CVU09_12580 [Bacteroidetes bacterium HGW-Bacteroidetes-4]|nr:MAG: hypothetical protein CVU09_12580 [Bacteroidetes bacterium HGW-Bacteroidetes-4]
MKRNLLKFRLQFRTKNLLRLFLNPNETPLRKSVAMALGVFIGVIPIWGGQIIGGLATAQYFKLNKPLVVIGTYINLTPLFPIIAFLSLKLGFLLANQSVSLPSLSQINFELLQTYFWYFLIGSIPVAVITAVFFGLATYSGIYLFRFLKFQSKQSVNALKIPVQNMVQTPPFFENKVSL